MNENMMNRMTRRTIVVQVVACSMAVGLGCGLGCDLWAQSQSAPCSVSGEDIQPAPQDAPALKVALDCSEVPELEAWCQEAIPILVEWYPRIVSLLASDGFTPPDAILLMIKKSDKGVGATAGTKIIAYSGWVTQHPDDVGMLVHELTHVIQRYPKPQPWWVTEGVADYIRWAIYEDKPLEWFSVPQSATGYTKGYRVAAGFLLWLESGPAPGIVRKLNTAMRNRRYNDTLFEDATGKPLSALWSQYQQDRKRSQ